MKIELKGECGFLIDPGTDKVARKAMAAAIAGDSTYTLSDAPDYISNGSNASVNQPNSAPASDLRIFAFKREASII